MRRPPHNNKQRNFVLARKMRLLFFSRLFEPQGTGKRERERETSEEVDSFAFSLVDDDDSGGGEGEGAF